MRRQVKNLAFILEQQLQPYSCLAEVRQKGPILEVMVRHIPGEVPDGDAITAIVKTGLDAVFAPDIQKVSVYALPLRDRDGLPQRLGSFAYEGVEQDLSRPVDVQREDYLLFRLGLLVFGILGIAIYLFVRDVTLLMASLLAIGLAIAFPSCKRTVQRLPALMQRLIVLAGSFLVGVALVFLILKFPETLGWTALVLVIGGVATRLGWQ